MGIIVSLAALAIIFWFVDLRGVQTALSQANYRYLLPVLVMYVISFAARAKAWRTLLQEKESFRRVFLTLNAGYLLNNVLPFRLGEFGRAFLLGRRGMGFWRVFSTILIERSFDLILASGLLLATLPFVWGAPQARPTALAFGSIVLIGLVALYLLARYQGWVVNHFEKLAARWPRLLQQGKGRLEAFLSGLAVLTDFHRFLRALGWMVFSWLLAVGVQFLLFRAFLPTAKLLWIAFGFGVSALGVAIPSSPGYLGVYEAAWVGALSFFVDPDMALAYALVSHLMYLVVTGVFGAYALFREGESIWRLYRTIRKESF